MLARPERPPRSISLTDLVVAAILVLATSLPSFAAADRYGGVWHPGKGTGAFVPIATGMKLEHVMAYRESWGEDSSLRLTDIEVVAKGCPADTTDVFATKWETGEWNDKIEIYSSIGELESAARNECENGYELVDFEIWRTHCEGDLFIGLFRETEKCTAEPEIIIDGTSIETFAGLLTQRKQEGYRLVDFELDIPLSTINPPVDVVGVWYPGTSQQEFYDLNRPDFEAEMLAREGTMTLVDMESYRAMEFLTDIPERHVVGLWEVLPDENADDHEVGETYSKFSDLIYMDENTRNLVDFEVYADTLDRRFARVIERYFDYGGGASIAVLQSGELVSEGTRGFAKLPEASQPGQLMTISTRGAVASVTKFITTLGVMRYADYVLGDLSWIDEAMVDHLPNDFGPFGAGVENITIRDLLRHTSGLSEFQPTSDLLNAQQDWRDEMIAFLGEPLPTDPTLVPGYQNIHFELLALIMDEVELPKFLNDPEPWTWWIENQVFAFAGIGPLDCGGNPGDALPHPVSGGPSAKDWIDSSWSCAGFGTGAAMYWASPLELAKLSWAVRDNAFLSPAAVELIYSDGLGLDWAYANDGDSDTSGERIYGKGGGLGRCEWPDQVGAETLMARYDDYDVDDTDARKKVVVGPESGGPVTPGPATPTSGSSSQPDHEGSSDDYAYNPGGRDFDVGLMVHRSAYSGCPTVEEFEEGNIPRGFPTPLELLQEAVLQPEDW